MASVPNMRAAPVPAPAGKTPAAVHSPGFAKQLAGIPGELLQIPASILAGAGDSPSADGAPADGAAAATDATTDAPSEAAQLAALAPLLQSLPAMVAAIPATPAPQPVPTQAPETQVKVEASAAKAPAPTASLPTPMSAPVPAGRIGKAKPESENGETESDAGTPEPAGTLDAAAREALSTAKKVIEATLRAAEPALAGAAPKAARAGASALQSVKDALPSSVAAEAKAIVDDIVASATLASQAAPATTPTAPAQPREAAAPAPDRSLDLANEAEWLDRLARDIAQASGNEGTIRFKLHPQTLGHLSVELSQGDHGTSIRLTADTEHARSILADAQPRLVAEARAQGVRIAETHVDLSGSDRHASGDPRRQDDTSRTPMIRTARDAAADADAPERPGRLKSDRYA